MAGESGSGHETSMGCSVWRVVKSISVEPLMLLGMYASFLSFPTTVQLVYDRVCSTIPNCTNVERQTNSSVFSVTEVEQEMQTESSHILLYTNLALGIPSGVVSLLFGHFSDGHGTTRDRKPFMLMCLLMSVLSKFILLCTAQLNASVYFVVLANFLDGCGGSYPVLNLLMYAYIADISSSEERTKRIAILESSLYFAAGAASITSGFVIANLGFAFSYLICMSVFLMAVIYVVFGLCKSEIPKSDQTSATIDNPLRATHCSGKLDILSSSNLSHNRRVALCVTLLTVFFTTQSIFLGLDDIDYLFALGRPLYWSPQLLGFFSGYLLLANGLANAVIPTVLTHLEARRGHSVPDYGIVCVGLVSGIILLVGIGVSELTWHMFLAATLGSLRGLYTSTLRSMLSKIASENHEGVMFAVLSILQTLASIMASAFYNSVYPPTRRVWPGLAFVIMGITLLPPLIMMFFIRIFCGKRNPRPEESSIISTVQ